MIGAKLFVGITATGLIRVYVWGQADGHIMDWRGCNFRIKLAPDQPYRFESVEAAKAWAVSRFPTQNDLWDWAERAGDGAHMKDRHPMGKYLTPNRIDLPYRCEAKEEIEGPPEPPRRSYGLVYRSHRRQCLLPQGHKGDHCFSQSDLARLQ